MFHRPFVVATLCLLLVSGCGPKPVTWQCEFGEDSGSAALDTEHVKVVFEGVKVNQTPGREGGGSTGSLQVAGGGTSQITLSALNHTLKNSYAGKVNKVTLGQYQVEISDGGRKLVVGNKSFEIGKDKQTIVIHEDGTASLRESK